MVFQQIYLRQTVAERWKGYFFVKYKALARLRARAGSGSRKVLDSDTILGGFLESSGGLVVVWRTFQRGTGNFPRVFRKEFA